MAPRNITEIAKPTSTFRSVPAGLCPRWWLRSSWRARLKRANNTLISAPSRRPRSETPCPDSAPRPRKDMTTQSKKVFIRTFGCQMNEYDSEKMADVLAAAEGFEKTSDPADADLILFNTGSVR